MPLQLQPVFFLNVVLLCIALLLPCYLIYTDLHYRNIKSSQVYIFLYILRVLYTDKLLRNTTYIIYIYLFCIYFYKLIIFIDLTMYNKIYLATCLFYILPTLPTLYFLKGLFNLFVFKFVILRGKGYKFIL